MKIVGLILLLAVAFEFVLLFGDFRVLLGEEHIRVNEGQSRFVEGYGDLGVGAQDSLLCTYFNGWKKIEVVYWYASNDMFGKSACPFFRRTNNT